MRWARRPEDHEYAYIGDEGYPWYSTGKENIEYFSTRKDLGAGDLPGYFEMENRVQAAGIGWALTKLWPEAIPGVEPSADRFVNTRTGCARARK